MATDWTADAKGTASSRGQRHHLYFETHGPWQPLILLHGGLGPDEMFGPVLPLLRESHRVVAVDLQGHGRAADIDRPVTFKQDRALVESAAASPGKTRD